MGRYLVGTAGFSYKYVFGEQAANLSWLAGESGVGEGGMVPVLSASMDALEQTDWFPVFELLREHARRAGDDEAWIGDLSPAGSGESLCYLVGEQAIPLVVALDARLPAVAERVLLEARGAYGLDRSDHQALLDWIRGSAPDLDLDLAAVRDRAFVEAAMDRLGDTDDHLPAMALWILHHAAANDLDRIEVSERMPEISLGPDGGHDELWEVIRREWGPPELSSSELPDDPDALFARGLICGWAGDQDAALAALRRGRERGDARTGRWLRE